ncbi:MAG: hypothetical protein JRN62_04150 [Nitrososphaerota archaeon]|jgi:hypothetical protein|nr:hypothetical protein [Nitrososphaerota archaeon]MDG6948795.1 hypothetical protein [Nitrososphaerota archaeon]
MKISRRYAISELFAALMIVAITLSFGSVVTYSAMNYFGLADSAAQQSANTQQQAASKLISLVYANVVPGSGGCVASYGGVEEGTILDLGFYNYGSAQFNTAVVYLNDTFYSGYGFSPLAPGNFTTWQLTTVSCMHSSGQTLLISDSSGAEVQIET